MHDGIKRDMREIKESRILPEFGGKAITRDVIK